MRAAALSISLGCALAARCLFACCVRRRRQGCRCGGPNRANRCLLDGVGARSLASWCTRCCDVLWHDKACRSLDHLPHRPIIPGKIYCTKFCNTLSRWTARW